MTRAPRSLGQYYQRHRKGSGYRRGGDIDPDIRRKKAQQKKKRKSRQQSRSSVEKKKKKKRKKKRKNTTNLPRADHPLGLVPLTLEGPALDEGLNKLLLAVAQPDLGQVVLVRDDLVLYARQAEQQRANDARPVLARAAVDQDWRRLLLAG